MRLQVLPTILLLLLNAGCQGQPGKPLPAADRPELYLPLLSGKSVAVVANQTSMAGSVQLVDFLLSRNIRVIKIFTPEHGFRGTADAGERISNGKDPVSGLPLISLYGSHFKPAPGDLSDLDILIYDIQDVGVRFYTYISTLHYVMEACAENNISLIVLDRPDPNGYYCDGNIPDTAFRSFVCMHPVPVVYGMTTGEYAKMINGEKWLKKGLQCKLTVIKCNNYTHKSHYELPVRPSPNLQDQVSVYLYPSLCLFEGTNISVGRGTPFPFSVFGSPLLPDRGFSFTPGPTAGSKNPPFSGQECYGTDLRDAVRKKLVPADHIILQLLLDAYKSYPAKDKFFTSYFDVLAGGPHLREQIEAGMSEKQIRNSWKDGLKRFSEIRKKYLIYD